MANSLSTQFEGFTRLPVNKQISLMILVSAVIAMAAVVMLWMRSPTWQTLHTPHSGRESAQVVELLTKAAIPYRIEEGSGAIQINAQQFNDARQRLASAGLSDSHDMGFELLSEQALGTSQFMEQARYHKAMEGELERTIASLAGITSARVHLAIPKDSPFLRNARPPSASVLVQLAPGRFLGQETTDAIIHLVASSVPNLVADLVSVVDQTGRLHTSVSNSGALDSSGSQLEYKRKVEQLLVNRIESIVSPITGFDGVRAEVTAEFDFDRVEQTEEMFDPNRAVIRSQQREARLEGGLALAGGVPGALSNQPPGLSGGQAPPANQLANQTVQAGQTQTAQAGNNPDQSRVLSDNSVTNFEMDRKISHRQRASGIIHRLSIAVLVNEKSAETAITEEQMSLITNLVRQASGFDEARGDSISVTKALFQAPPDIAATESHFWEKGWIPGALRQTLGGLMLFLIVFLLVRPLTRNLGAQQIESANPGQRQPAASAGSTTGRAGGMDDLLLRLPELEKSENRLEFARNLAESDPKRLSQVIKSWIATDA